MLIADIDIIRKAKNIFGTRNLICDVSNNRMFKLAGARAQADENASKKRITFQSSASKVTTSHFSKL